MSTPSENDDTQLEDGTEKSKSFTDRVNEAVKAMTKGSDGNWVIPEGLPEEVQVAAIAEKRYRDTQSEFTRIKQENKALLETKSVLLKKAVGNVEISLTPEQKEELDDLKFSNPEEWRKKMNALESDAISTRSKELDEEVKKVASTSLEQIELERRKGVLEQFKKDNPDFKFDDDVWANDIPPRINKKLENGSITFEQFLSECYGYLKTGKAIKQDDVTNDPNLSKIGGGNKPDNNAVKEDAILSYNKETY